MTSGPLLHPTFSGLSDEEVVSRILEGEIALFEVMMRRYNQRLYRVARAILRNDGDAEDVVQDAYVRAYEHLAQFAGKAAFSTWLTRIAVHEALARKRRNGRLEELEAVEKKDARSSILKASVPNPESESAQHQTRQLLEESIEALPADYRTVVVMRDVEEMNVAETAAILEVSEALVKTRLHRAHAMLRKELFTRGQGRVADLYPFLGARCDRMVRAVLERIGLTPRSS